jgi:acetyl-CoA C-acetyltransferase
MGDASAVDALLRDGLHDAFSGRHSGWHTEGLVQRFNISRAKQDAYASKSQRRFAAAQQAAWFGHEIAPTTIEGHKGDVVLDKDESNRPETTVESLAKLRPAFRPDGTITAGNAPDVNTGASAMVVTSAEKACSLRLEPMLLIRSVGLAAVEPDRFGLGPIPAIEKAVSLAGGKLVTLTGLR